MMPTWLAPAKLNLFLHITGRRPDGYHCLQTLYQFLDIHDRLQFEITQDGRIALATPLTDVPTAQNLCVRAAQLLQAECASKLGVIIHLEKHIPIGGGFGGGSSDAATCLLVLNKLWNCGLSLAALAVLGLRLGADVPVFIGGDAAWAEGVGELLTRADPPEHWFVVLIPPVRVSTAQAFTAFNSARDLTPYRPAITIRDFHAGQTQNDLTPVVRRLFPAVDKALNWLGQFGPARMTGSGSGVFLPVVDQAAGAAILAQCPKAIAENGFVTRGLNRHPLHAQLRL